MYVDRDVAMGFKGREAVMTGIESLETAALRTVNLRGFEEMVVLKSGKTVI